LESEFYIENEDILTPLITCFESTWIGILDRRGRRRQPQYPIEMWNCSERLQNDLPRANDSIEGWHNAFLALMTCKKPVIWKMYKCIAKRCKLNKNNLKRVHFWLCTNQKKKGAQRFIKNIISNEY